MSLNTLWDSPVLAPIARAAARTGVELELLGSVATRAMLFDIAQTPALSLFDLAEHVSDIDLGHSGTAAVTTALRTAIAEEVPMAPWFRWSIMDRGGLAQFNRLQQFNINVPLRQIRLGTRHQDGTDNTRRLLLQALAGKVEIFPNDAFFASPRSAFDTQASAALLHIDAILDVFDTQRRSGRPLIFDGDTKTAELVKTGVARLEALSPMGRNAALRRLWYRLAGMALRMSPDLFDAAVNFFKLEPLLEVLKNAGFPANFFGRSHMRPILISAQLGNGAFRTKLDLDTGDYSTDAERSLDEVLRKIPAPGNALPLVLAPGSKAIAAIKSLQLHQGHSPSSVKAGPLAEEFVHVGLPISSQADPLDVDRLTAVVIGYDKTGAAILPVFASVSAGLDPSPIAFDSTARAPKRYTIRINLAQSAANIDEIDIFLVKGT